MEITNNLATSSSPYLRQHKDNPIAWQEFGEQALAYARETGKPLFVSIGYATCHWCHVMAADTFSNQEIADFLNEHFVNIKVDREQRPDIDSYCMQFIQQNYGRGGWPLNVVLTPDLKPFFAATYIGSTPRYGMPDFMTVIKQVLEFHNENKDELSAYSIEPGVSAEFDSPDLTVYARSIDRENWGFTSQQKFPPHSSLLYLLSNDQAIDDPTLRDFAFNTLMEMQNSGLADQVGGGFFRYCVDQKWQIPHFEKMLYDQAMMLINYSLGYARFGDETFKETINRLLFCLQDTFRNGDLYVSGHDADTDHEEGTTYLWKPDEIRNILKDKYDEFFANYELIPFEGSNHLARINYSTLAYELYDSRKKRPQPSVDNKFLTPWNALVGVAFCFVEKYAGIKTPVRELYSALLKQRRSHSTNGDLVQKDYFLEDAASILLLQTYMVELGLASIQDLETSEKDVHAFNVDGQWIENPSSDFLAVSPQEFDHPTPSSATITQWALVRSAILSDKEIPELKFKAPLNFDAFNYVAMFAREHHHIKSATPIADVPFLNIFQESADNTICHHGSCVPL